MNHVAILAKLQTALENLRDASPGALTGEDKARLSEIVQRLSALIYTIDINYGGIESC